MVRNRCEGRCRVLFTPTLEGDPTCLIRKVAPPTCLIRQLPYTAGASVHVGADRFDAAITEEISDDLPGGDCISTARFCRAGLLRPSGTFYPRRAAMCAHLPYMATTCLMWQLPALYGNHNNRWAQLVGVRVCHVAGFDVRGFNVFRSTTGAVYDLEEVRLLLL